MPGCSCQRVSQGVSGPYACPGRVPTAGPPPPGQSPAAAAEEVSRRPQATARPSVGGITSNKNQQTRMSVSYLMVCSPSDASHPDGGARRVRASPQVRFTVFLLYWKILSYRFVFGHRRWMRLLETRLLHPRRPHSAQYPALQSQKSAAPSWARMRLSPRHQPVRPPRVLCWAG